jgi:hypothetical protein
MRKILIAGAGGAPSEGVIRSLLRSKKGETIIGMGSEAADLMLSAAERKYLVPYANSPDYEAALTRLLQQEQPDLIHFQNDLKCIMPLFCVIQSTPAVQRPLCPSMR